MHCTSKPFRSRSRSSLPSGELGSTASSSPLGSPSSSLSPSRSSTALLLLARDDPGAGSSSGAPVRRTIHGGSGLRTPPAPRPLLPPAALASLLLSLAAALSRRLTGLFPHARVLLPRPPRPDCRAELSRQCSLSLQQPRSAPAQLARRCAPTRLTPLVSQYRQRRAAWTGTRTRPRAARAASGLIGPAATLCAVRPSLLSPAILQPRSNNVDLVGPCTQSGKPASSTSTRSSRSPTRSARSSRTSRSTSTTSRAAGASRSSSMTTTVRSPAVRLSQLSRGPEPSLTSFLSRSQRGARAASQTSSTFRFGRSRPARGSGSLPSATHPGRTRSRPRVRPTRPPSPRGSVRRRRPDPPLSSPLARSRPRPSTHPGVAVDRARRANVRRQRAGRSHVGRFSLALVRAQGPAAGVGSGREELRLQGLPEDGQAPADERVCVRDVG